MSEKKEYTERDLILAKREAFTRGAYIHVPRSCRYGDASQRAIREYPLPKITRPRVVKNDYGEWKIENGAVWFRYVAAEWRVCHVSSEDWQFTVNILRPLADLLANPTEEVEDDG